MTDTLTPDTTDSLAKEIGVALVKATAQAAVETVGAFAILAAAGFGYQAWESRKAKKLAAKQAN